MDVEGSAEPESAAFRTMRSEWEADLSARYGSVFREVDHAVGVARAAMLIVEEDRIDHPALQDLIYVVIALGARTVLVAHECLALLRTGFLIGARARWRTLVEIITVSRVLLRGDLGIYSRYLHHRWILVAMDLERTGKTSATVTQKRDDLVAEYGASYSSRYGWAAQLTAELLPEVRGSTRPQLWHLERLASYDYGRAWVLTSHHAVHADSLGLLTLVDETGAFHPGPSEAGMNVAAQETIRGLADAINGLLKIVEEYRVTPQATLLRQIVGDLFLTALQVPLFAAQASSEVSPIDFPFRRNYDPFEW